MLTILACSGLDSTSSLAVMNALKAVAEKGRLTVMCVIHQPRYEIFSKYRMTSMNFLFAQFPQSKALYTQVFCIEHLLITEIYYLIYVS